MNNAFNWQGAPSVTKQTDTSARIKFFAGLQTVVLQPGAISIVGAEQHRADVDKRDALKRCISMSEAA